MNKWKRKKSNKNILRQQLHKLTKKLVFNENKEEKNLWFRQISFNQFEKKINLKNRTNHCTHLVLAHTLKLFVFSVFRCSFLSHKFTFITIFSPEKISQMVQIECGQSCLINNINWTFKKKKHKNNRYEWNTYNWWVI